MCSRRFIAACVWTMTGGFGVAGCAQDKSPTPAGPSAPTITKRAELVKQKAITSALAFTPDGALLASGAGHTGSFRSRGEVTLWDTRTWQRVRTVPGLGGAVETLAFTPDGAGLMVRSVDVSLVDVASGKKRFSNLGGGTAFSAALSPDGRWVATAREESPPQRSCVQIADTRTGQRVQQIAQGRERICSVAFSPDGRTLAVGARGRRVQLWDVSTWTKRSEFDGGETARFTPDGKGLFSGGGVSVGRILNVETGVPQVVFTDQPGSLWDLAFAPDGRMLATGEDRLKIWDARSGAKIFEWKPPPQGDGAPGAVCAVAFAPDGKTLVAAGWDGAVTVWDVSAPK